MTFYDALATHLTQRKLEFDALPDDDVAKRAAITELRELVARVRDLQSNLAWVDAAATPPLDLGTTYFVENAARQLVAGEIELTVVAAHEATYATSIDPYGQAIKRWGDPSRGDENVIVVFVPRREQHSGLLHPLIIHELGHAAAQKHDLTRQMLSEAAKRKRVQSRFATVVQAQAKRDGVAVRAAAAAVGWRLGKWLEETLCDSIAIQYLGPTYLYSFLAEVAAENLDDPGKRHPPPRQRIGLLIDQLDALGWSSVMTAAAPDLDDWVRGLANDRPSYADTTGFLVHAINALAPALRKVVAAHVGGATFEPDAAELAEIDKLLARRIPPAQLPDGAASSRPAIILCSWLHALREAGGDLPGIASAPDAPELASLLPKGLEMTALVEAWEAGR